MNKSIPKFLFFLCAFFTLLNASAQEQFLTGSVISPKGDTLSGYIDYKTWKTNPKEITFKNQLDQTPVLFTPSNIQGFTVKNDIYLSATVNTQTNSQDAKNLENVANIKLKEEQVFLKTLINGTESLYVYEDEQHLINFYILQDGKIMLLPYKRYLKETTTLAENNKYKGLLSLYLKDCPTIQSEINKASYTQESLTTVFEKYYKCIGSEISFKKTKEKVDLEFGIVAGISSTNLEFSNDKQFKYLTGEFDSSTNFTAGLSFDIIFPQHHKKWSIHNDLLYITYNNTSTYEDYTNENIYTLYETEIGNSFIELNNLVRYSQNLGKLSIFFNAGISNGFVIKEDTYVRKESHNYSNVDITETEATPNSSSIETGPILGAGLTYKNMALEFRYKFSNGVFQQFDSKVNRLYVLLSYKL
ncbi:hypothetical protein [Formosa sp. PL04]|uniref:hypothetical protein n=1 Tax=Formosa sp. PL04 TaxID=3081755 RepID=UPI002982A0F0|nr:hypothetical protein [Formosa sp. PL04]MDW5289279.1 hypothetical protein [Formosa sp. PL04]